MSRFGYSPFGRQIWLEVNARPRTMEMDIFGKASKKLLFSDNGPSFSNVVLINVTHDKRHLSGPRPIIKVISWPFTYNLWAPTDYYTSSRSVPVITLLCLLKFPKVWNLGCGYIVQHNRIKDLIIWGKPSIVYVGIIFTEQCQNKMFGCVTLMICI